MGPCLCGDPYCPSCGNPSAAAWVDLTEEISEQVMLRNPIDPDDLDATLEAISATLDFLSGDAEICTALENWMQRLAASSKSGTRTGRITSSTPNIKEEN